MSALAIQFHVEHRRQAGFSLIELMIALALGLLVLGAAIAVFQSNQRTFSANQGQNRIQEGARVAYELMSKDIRAAGGTACSKLAMPEVEHTNNTSEDALLTAPISGSGSEFTVTSADDSAYQIDSATTTTVKLSADQVDKISDAFKVDDKLVLCNASQLYVVTITGVTDSSRTLTFTPATPQVITVDPMAPAGTVAVARYRSNRWYISNGGLYVSRDGGAGQQVIDGVTALTASYLQDGASSYSAAPTQWTSVSAVRVNLTLSGSNVDGRSLTRNTSSVVSLRSRTL